MALSCFSASRMTDEDYMQPAIAQARLAADAGEVPVGAIIVDPKSGEIIARAANAPIRLNDPCAHAEILVIRDAANAIGNYRLTGLTLYVTLEPCTMCAGAISHARLGRVVYGASDVKGGAVDNGVKFYGANTCHHKPAVSAGILKDECAGLLKDFFKKRRSKQVKPETRQSLR